jgi:hypothetical protein
LIVSGAILLKSPEIDLSKITGILWRRADKEVKDLRSFFQVTQERYQIRKNSFAVKGQAVHEESGFNRQLKEDKNGFIIQSVPQVYVRTGETFISDGYIVVNNIANRDFVRQIINNGLNLSDNNRAEYLSIDTNRMSRDFSDHWVRGFDGRTGRIQKGTVYGNSVEQDISFGDELARTNSKSIGIYTQFFGDKTKVRISSGGSIMVYKDITPEVFLRYIEDEIFSYRIHQTN